MEHGSGTPEALVAQQLSGLQADPTRSALLSAYVAALTDDAGWGVEAVAGLAGASRQSISKRRKQGRQVRAENDPQLRKELAELELPRPPVRAARTRSGLRIPDAEEIVAREVTWVAGQLADPAGAENTSDPKAVQARLRLAVGLLEDADAKVASFKELRAAVAWSLTCFDPRAGQGLQRAGHWQPDEFFEARTQALAPAAELKGLGETALRDLAQARGIEPPEDVERERDRYFTVTSQLLAAQARRRAVVQRRDELVRRFVKRDAAGRFRGVTEVAEWIGRTQSQVTQICESGPTSPVSDSGSQGVGQG